LGDERTAVLETASAVGLTRLAPWELDPTRASSFGLGEQILQALRSGAEKLLIGLGGSGFNDAGVGMLRALGLRFLDVEGRDVSSGCLGLAKLASLDDSGLSADFRKAAVVAATDVLNPVLGPNGATAVFGPQKGVTPETAGLLEEMMERFLDLAEDLTGRRVRDSPGSGAAGGLGAALALFSDCRTRSGVEVVLDLGRFAEKARGADLIVVGEGRSDSQTAWGKAPVGAAVAGRELGALTVCLSGALGEGYRSMYDRGVDAVMNAVPGPMDLAEAMGRAAELLEDAAERLGRLLSVGSELPIRRL
jgi:glycerate kinase